MAYIINIHRFVCQVNKYSATQQLQPPHATALLKNNTERWKKCIDEKRRYRLTGDTIIDRLHQSNSS
jgi:hypothetical protein